MWTPPLQDAVEKPKGKRAQREALGREALRRADELTKDVAAMRRVCPASQHVALCEGTASFLNLVAAELLR
jgi:hypothetical protein